MKRIVAAIAIAFLAGCGLDTAGSAATAAALKKQQLEEGKKVLEAAQQKVGEARELQQQRVDSAADGADK